MKMGSKLTSRIVQDICRGMFHTRANSNSIVLHKDSDSDLAGFLEQKLNSELPTQTSNGASIYRVPTRLRSVEPKAYEPNIVSIGPYHNGSPHLEAMEKTKWSFFHRLFGPTNQNRPDLGAIVSELNDIEHKARSCYSEDFKMSSKNFIKMMLIDSCFIVEVLREAREIDFGNKSLIIKRWMLPVLQRDFIMLENQIPLFVLSKVYNLTSSCTYRPTDDLNLKKLALRFFEPMIYRDLEPPGNISFTTEGEGESHFLELFRASICPTEIPPKEGHQIRREPYMFRSISELKESGVKLKKAEKSQPLDISFKIRNGVLKIPPVIMDDYRFTLFRNMVAFEQCHVASRPHITAYVFFLDRLINSEEDIEMLHYAGVMQHSLGGNRNAAQLVNKLCKEVAGAGEDSYLHNILWMINCYCNDGWNQKRAKLKHEYFYNVWVSLSTMAAIVLIYLTILQTICGMGDQSARAHMIGTGFWISIAEAFSVPFTGVSPLEGGLMDVEYKFQKDEEKSMDVKAWIPKYICCFFSFKVPEDIHPLFFMSC